MQVSNDAFIPYEFDKKQDCLSYIIDRCFNIKKSIRLVEKGSEHLVLRCPLSGDFINVIGTIDEIAWIDRQLRVDEMYRPTH